MTTYASGVYTNDSALGKIYHGEAGGEVQRMYKCKETVFVPQKEPFNVDFLIVAGGGGGTAGFAAGGGGAGGMRIGTKKFYKDTSYTVTVGAGGAAGSTTDGASSTASGSVGGDSSVERRSHGGGVTGTDGGSGGGQSGSMNGSTSSSNATNTDCSDSDSQGKDGADANGLLQGGGGGGHSAAATNENGGNGSANSITGSSVTYAGGGGGGSFSSTEGSGGSGGGGAGGVSDSSTTYSASNAVAQTRHGGHGTANKGGGGGGGGYYVWDTGLGYNTNVGGGGGNGGSGFVVLKYPKTKAITVGSGLTSSTATSGDYKITQITAGTDTISFSGPILTIAKISDGSSSYAVEVVFSLTSTLGSVTSSLPAGTTKLRYTISGTGSTSTVVTIPTSTASNTIHNGTGGSSSFRSKYNSSTNRGSFYHGPGDSVSNISLTVEALDNASTILSTSNTLTGLKIDEDG